MQKQIAQKKIQVKAVQKPKRAQMSYRAQNHPYSQAQGVIGNHGVLSRYSFAVVQAKLAVGSQNDRYEQEADQVAETVMRMSEPRIDPAGQSSRIVSKPSRKALRGKGQPLSKSVRAFFEPRFGYDFSQVRLHTDLQAASASKILNARAFTLGRDIAFATGQYAPNTVEGKGLLAHELTHLAQQNRLTPLSRESLRVQAVAPAEMTIQRRPDNGDEEEESSVQVGASTPIIFFRYNSTDLRQDAEADSVTHLAMALRIIQQHLAATGDSGRIILHGYASIEGDEAHNRELSQRRADRVRDLLVDAGVPQERITSTGHGPDDTIPGLEWNRRVEIELTPTVTRIEMEAERVTIETFSELSLTDERGNILPDPELSRRLPQAVRVNVTDGTTPDMEREERRLAEVVRVLNNYRGRLRFFVERAYLPETERSLARVRLRLSERTNETGRGPAEFANAPVSMIFDGTNLNVEQADGTTRTYGALSGRGEVRSDRDTSVRAQRMEGQGPIPEGGYWIDPCERTSTRWSPGDWGNVRIVLHPYDTTATYGRGGFFLHGGASPGSAGCVEIQNGREIEIIDQQLRSTELCRSGRKVNVTVAYEESSE